MHLIDHAIAREIAVITVYNFTLDFAITVKL